MSPDHADVHRPFCDAYFSAEKRESVITGQVPALRPRNASS